MNHPEPQDHKSLGDAPNKDLDSRSSWEEAAGVFLAEAPARAKQAQMLFLSLQLN